MTDRMQQVQDAMAADEAGKEAARKFKENNMEDPIAGLPSHAFGGGVGKFASKLDDADRCAILALYRTGVRRAVLAEAFGIDQRTVTNIANPHSLKYRRTRERAAALGQDALLSTYVTEDIVRRVREAADALRGKGTDTEKPAIQKGPNPRATGKAGTHVITLPHLAWPHEVDIEFKREGEDGVEVTGWHYRDRSDPDYPNMWLNNGEESLQTSQACLNAFVLNVT